MKKFEYKIVIGEHRPEQDAPLLNELGEEGWEVIAVSVVPIQKRGEIFGNRKSCYLLKREMKT